MSHCGSAKPRTTAPLHARAHLPSESMAMMAHHGRTILEAVSSRAKTSAATEGRRPESGMPHGWTSPAVCSQPHLHRGDHRLTAFVAVARAPLVVADPPGFLVPRTNRFFPVHLAIFAIVLVEPRQEPLTIRSGRTAQARARCATVFPTRTGTIHFRPVAVGRTLSVWPVDLTRGLVPVGTVFAPSAARPATAFIRRPLVLLVMPRSARLHPAHGRRNFIPGERLVAVAIGLIQHRLDVFWGSVRNLIQGNLPVAVGIQPFEEVRWARRASALFLGHAGPRSQHQDQGPGKECHPDSHSSLLSSVVRGTSACLFW